MAKEDSAVSRLQIRKVGTFVKRCIEREEKAVSIEDIAPGVHATDDVFFKVVRPGLVEWVISRVCDHANGKLMLCDDGQRARCPLHGWELDTTSLRYQNVNIDKVPIPYRLEGDTLYYEVEHSCLDLPNELCDATDRNVTVRFLAHACIAIDIDNVRIVTDPWLFGPCFTTGWWPAAPPKNDVLEIIRDATLVYVSHNHSDHMHEETLRHVAKSTPIIVPAFPSQSVAGFLRHMGFTHVHPLDFNTIYRVGRTGVSVSILRAGDFREDSGLFLTAGSFSALLTVDSNKLNNYILPHRIDLLMTSFAGGATGFPLCFELFTPGEKVAIIQRNRRTQAAQAYRYVDVVKPKVYVPYAGFFTEAAEREVYIRKHNAKNTSREIVKEVATRFPTTLAVDPLETDTVLFSEGEIRIQDTPFPRLYRIDREYTERYLETLRLGTAYFDIAQVRDYFVDAGFVGHLRLYLVPTDDTFTPVDDGVLIDFSPDTVEADILRGDELLRRFVIATAETKRHLLIKVRRDSLWHVVSHHLPLEELSIGFQCRIDRKPNVYNSDFWQHFTNVPFHTETEQSLASGDGLHRSQ